MTQTAWGCKVKENKERKKKEQIKGTRIHNTPLWKDLCTA